MGFGRKSALDKKGVRTCRKVIIILDEVKARICALRARPQACHSISVILVPPVERPSIVTMENPAVVDVATTLMNGCPLT